MELNVSCVHSSLLTIAQSRFSLLLNALTELDAFQSCIKLFSALLFDYESNGVAYQEILQMTTRTNAI